MSISKQYSYYPHTALFIPEIINHILSFILPTNNIITSTTTTKEDYSCKDLIECLCVNTFWHDCAARLLWRDVAFDESNYNSFVKFANTLGEEVQQNEQITLSQEDNLSASTTTSLAVANNPIIRHTSLFSNCLDFLFMPPTPPEDNDKDNNSIDDSDYDDDNHNHSNIMTEKGILLLNDTNKYISSSISSSTTTTTTTVTTQSDNKQPFSNISFYRSALRSLTIRKIKKDSINDFFADKIARHCTRLEQIDFYICDHVNNATISPLIQHGQLTHISLAGCYQITDECIIQVANTCQQLEHLDLRACGQISDVSISAIAMQCGELKHLNVGRVRDRHRITVNSIRLIAMHTKVTVLGLAGCQIDDECMLLMAQYRNHNLERISVNSCQRITNVTIKAYAQYCPNLSVFEMKECHLINDWETVTMLAQRKVLMTLCKQQDQACSTWAKRQGIPWGVTAPSREISSSSS
ncbi:hypothetical protein INT45_007773 [Circinella minor]|uniref:F-box/LRR-repeat protein 15-like leucin rich repeat domain-containing protein n=1 Tax=Circinella minor TaxID=1195481 RepID=A0A8H7RXP9_9FUNG|nr:hypothetical protein INT45_007773 [Circinella minor]